MASKADKIKSDEKKQEPTATSPSGSAAVVSQSSAAGEGWDSGIAMAKFQIKNSGDDLVSKLADQKAQAPAPTVKSLVKEAAAHEAESFQERAEKIENQHLEKMKMAMRAV